MNISVQKPRVSVSTWSLHRTIGDPVFYGVGQSIPVDTHNKGTYTLLELPKQVAAAGINTMEICHFHLPTLDSGYLQELRGELQQANVELFSLLVDDGDLTHVRYAERDLAWVSQWLPVAQQLGAHCTRVIAGKSAPTSENVEKGYVALRQLATQAQEHGVRLMTENWYELLSQPEPIIEILERLNGDVGLCLDFGNWRGPEKYAGFERIAGYAESCHTKASFASPFVLDEEDYVRCLDITRQASFAGPYTLIYDGPDDNEWEGLKRELEVVKPYLNI